MISNNRESGVMIQLLFRLRGYRIPSCHEALREDMMALQ
jgi:hypothetical protein